MTLRHCVAIYRIKVRCSAAVQVLHCVYGRKDVNVTLLLYLFKLMNEYDLGKGRVEICVGGGGT